MKFSDTIIGSIIIGVLVGGAILLSGSDGHDKKHAQIKILKSPSEGKGVRELIHKEIIIDEDTKSEMKLHINSDEITKDLPSDIAATVEAENEIRKLELLKSCHKDQLLDLVNYLKLMSTPYLRQPGFLII